MRYWYDAARGGRWYYWVHERIYGSHWCAMPFGVRPSQVERGEVLL